MQSDIRDDKQLVIHAGYEGFVVAVVLLSIVNSILFLTLSGVEQGRVVLIVDLCIAVFLFADAFYRLLSSRNKRRFLFQYQGWLYFVGSLPAPFLRLLRLIPVFLMARRLRRSDYTAMGNVVVRKRAQSTLLFVILGAIVVLEAGAILILGAEARVVQANIHTASDALWWGIVTIATVGYGDKYPVTNQGRVIGIGMIVAGVALFSAITSFLAQWFLSTSKPKETAPSEIQPANERDVSQMLMGPQAKVDELRELLEGRDRAHQIEMQGLRSKLAELELTLHTQDPT